MRKSLDGAWNKIGDDLVKELDAMRLAQNTDDYKELLKNWDNVGGRGRRLGQRISKSELRGIKTFLSDMEVGFELHPKSGSEIIKGYFLPSGKPYRMPSDAAAMYIMDENLKAKMILRKGTTMYELFHEYMHLRHSREIGLEKYHLLGGRGTPGELIKETIVFKKIIEYKLLFTRKELTKALEYINDVRYKFGKYPTDFDFDIKTIPDIRKEISIHQILSKK